jgi:protein-S-isoprenylcysteine O-methyltransferase Ste14
MTAVEERSSIRPPRTFNLVEHARCLLRREILVLIPIYCLGLIPATALGALLIVRLERWLGVPSLRDVLSDQTRLALFLACLTLGAAIVSWSYTYLVLEGGGGPVPPFSASTRYLVTNGPYRHVRHPSLWGKLIGVVGLGLYLGSVTFLTVVVPLLLYWSLTWNTRRQDEGMERSFGDAYRAYRAVTPRMVPIFVQRLLP